MQYGKTKLIHMLRNIQQEGWTYDKIKDLIDSLWRDPMLVRWSGFENAGSPESTMSIDLPTMTFTIEPVDKYFGFYQFKTKLSYHVKKLAQEIILDATTGHHLIYFAFDDETSEQILHVIVNPTIEQEREIYVNECIVADLYFNFYTNRFVYFGDERHGSEWPSQVHWWAHRSLNGLRDHGLRITDIEIGDGSQDRHAQFGVLAGAMWAEDVLHEFDAIAWNVGLPVYYYDANGHEYDAISGFSFLTVGGIPAYNPESGPSTLDDKFYVLYHVFATNCMINPVFSVMGRYKYASLGEAYANASDELSEVEESIPQKTRLHIGTVVFHYDSVEYTNTYNFKIIGEVTPEDIAEAIAEDVTPYTKTGWTPNIQKEAYFTEDAGNTKIILEADPGPAQHFVEGDRRTPEPLTNLILLAQTGMQYIRKYLYNFDISVNPFAGNEKNFVMVSALYWNNRQGYFCYTGWRMHPWEMEPATRGNIIKKTGLELVSGLELSINTDVGLEHTVNITEGSIRLADITAEILDGGAALFKQQLTPLEARRYYLKTYYELSDPEDPLSELIITHEWEYQHLVANNVAKLSAGNQVEINKLDTGAWILGETADNDYSAMWLIATLDHQYPLKWIVGSEKSTDLDEAKELNTPETLLAILNAAQMMDHYIVLARVIVKNIAADPYYELAEVDQYGDGEFDAETKDRHVISGEFDSLTNEIILYRNANLPPIIIPIPGGIDGREVELSVVDNYIVWRYVGETVWNNLISIASITGPAGADGADGLPGADGAAGTDGREIELSVDSGYIVWRYVGDTSWINLVALSTLTGPAGADGADGTSMYTYVAYATDNSGAGFSLTPTDLLKYRAEIHVTSPLSPPTSGDFSGVTWVKYIGDDGEDGGGGGGTVAPELHLDFAEAGLEFIYNVPYSMKFTSQVSEAGDATLSTPLNTTMARYTKLTVTSTAAGLVSLYGEYV